MLIKPFVISNTLKVVHTAGVHAPLAQESDFNFQGLALILAGISLGLIGLVMAGSALFPEIAEQYKRHIPTVITGLILVAVASTIVGSLGG